MCGIMSHFREQPRKRLAKRQNVPQEPREIHDLRCKTHPPFPALFKPQDQGLESETFSPGNQGLSLRLMPAFWMASPIHWSVERLRVL